MSELPAEPYHKVRRRRLIAATAWALCGTLAVLAGVYGIGRLRGNPADAACQPAVQTAARLAPLVHGEVAALSLAHTGFLVPDLAFKDAAGHDRTLKDWRGRTVLLNLWATWCVPCRKEMPALDALQGKLGGPDFEVVAVNIDTRDPQKPLTFLKDVGIKRLGLFFRSERPRVRGSENRRQGIRHADDVADRPLRLRDRHHGGPGRMGERRRREIGERGD